jgi:hypothetical protein
MNGTVTPYSLFVLQSYNSIPSCRTMGLDYRRTTLQTNMSNQIDCACDVDEFVSRKFCLPCAIETYNSAGDLRLGSDTFCDECPAGKRVSADTGSCIFCATGKTNSAARINDVDCALICAGSTPATSTGFVSCCPITTGAINYTDVTCEPVCPSEMIPSADRKTCCPNIDGVSEFGVSGDGGCVIHYCIDGYVRIGERCCAAKVHATSYTGVCDVTDCELGYLLHENTCVAQLCEPATVPNSNKKNRNEACSVVPGTAIQEAAVKTVCVLSTGDATTSPQTVGTCSKATMAASGNCSYLAAQTNPIIGSTGQTVEVICDVGYSGSGAAICVFNAGRLAFQTPMCAPAFKCSAIPHAEGIFPHCSCSAPYGTNWASWRKANPIAQRVEAVCLCARLKIYA